MHAWRRSSLVTSSLLLLVGLTACGGDASSEAEAESTASPTASTSTPSAEPSAAPSFTDLDEVASPLDVYGDWLTTGEGGVWLTNDSGIVRLDPATGDQVAEIAVPQGACESTTTGLGFVWTATCGEPGVARIDPVTNKVTGHATLPDGTFLDSEGTIGVGSGSVWMVADGEDCHHCRVARIDADTMKVAAMIPVEHGAASVRYGFGHVWVVDPQQNLVQKIDPATEKVVQTTETGPSPRFFDVGEGGVWTLDQGDGTVTRIDPRSGKTTIIEAGVPGGGGDLAVGGGWVWARGGGSPLLVRIDPASHEVVETYGPPSGSGAVTVGEDAVWVSAHDIDRVWRLPLDVIPSD
jgi:streptogramin lyase